MFDLHSHTYFSFCGKDSPQELIEAVMAAGVDTLGISDHNYGVGDRMEQYKKELYAAREQYAGKIKILCGIELSTLREYMYFFQTQDFHGLDYCFLEAIGTDGSDVNKDFIELADTLPIPVGIAHTDMFDFAERYGFSAEDMFSKMAEHNIFWELNVNYDKTHGYREHAYVNEFMNNKEQQEIIHKTGVALSVGFDSHRCNEYSGERVRRANQFIEENGFKTALDIIQKKS